MKTFALLLLALLVPSFAFAAKAPTTATLRRVINQDMSSYRKMSQRQLQSKKFQAFKADAKNFKRIKLTPPGLMDVFRVAYVAKTVYPGKVFVMSSGMGPGPSGFRTSWRSGVLPKF